MNLGQIFSPPPGGVGIQFVRGLDRLSTYPELAKRAGLGFRFAVVQETYVEGCTDMYFDEALWRELAAFVQSNSRDGEIEVTSKSGVRMTLGEFSLH